MGQYLHEEFYDFMSQLEPVSAQNADLMSLRLLPTISSPRDLRNLNHQELNRLAEEIRQFLVQSVANTGGHLGPNLGVVELTIALHRVFNVTRDTFIFDTGHQTYVHKLLTGRQDFSRLRQRGGLSGYPSVSYTHLTLPTSDLV